MSTPSTVIPVAGNSVRSLQSFLRAISSQYTNAPLLIPDGIYGEQTKTAVIAFQKAFGLPQTGEVDYTSWIKIIEVYDITMSKTKIHREVVILHPKQGAMIPGNSGPHVYAVQGILMAISNHYSNLGEIKATGNFDEDSSKMVKKIQKYSNLEETGNIDRVTWDEISRLYEHINA